jgi:threonine/homoserine/homoserine lactone efflux protein
MGLIEFVITVVLITASGALAPGPLFFATVSHGTKTGAKGGLIFSISHTIVEFTLIMLLALGLLTIASETIVKNVIGIVGGIALVIFGLLQIYFSFKEKSDEKKQHMTSYPRLFFMGIILTGLNPYFIVWWLTAGAKLIIIALEFAALIGVIFMFICHVWMDYVWLTSIAYFSKKGTNTLAFKWYRIIIFIFGLVLVYYGISFIYDVMVI